MSNEIKELVDHFTREIESPETDLFVLPTENMKELLLYIKQAMKVVEAARAYIRNGISLDGLLQLNREIEEWEEK